MADDMYEIRNILREEGALKGVGRGLVSRCYEKIKDIETAWVYYPCMQVSDIFHMNIDVACAGMDQRKAHMLARDVSDKLNHNKPVCIHTPLLRGLQNFEDNRKEYDENTHINREISSKMSKSMPDRVFSYMISLMRLEQR